MSLTPELSDSRAAADDRMRSRRFALVMLLFFFVFAHRDMLEGQNVLSRMVAVESLVMRGVHHIDDSPYGPRWVALEDGRTVHVLSDMADLKAFMAGEPVPLRAVHDVEQPAGGRNLVEVREGTLSYVLNDMVHNKRDGHFYSSKPPVLTIVLAGVLRPLRGLGADLRFTRESARGLVFLLTWLVIGGVSAVGFYAFRRKVGEAMPGPRADAITALTLGGTLFLAYSVTVNHHTVTAVLVLLSFFALGLADTERGGRKPSLSAPRAAMAGVLMGLASVIDIGPGVVFSVGFALYIVLYLRSWRTLALFGAGAVPALALHCIVQYRLWGTVLPVQLISGTKDYPGSYWANKLPPDCWRIPRHYYWLLTLVSARGLFVLSPILIIGAAALTDDIRLSLRAARRGEGWRGLVRTGGPVAAPGYAALTALFGMVSYVLYTSFKAPTNFNGSCFGMRYYVGFMPILAFYAARAYVRWGDRPGFRKWFLALGAASVAFALIGMQQPWVLMEANSSPAVRALMLMRGFSP